MQNLSGLRGKNRRYRNLGALLC